MELKSLALDLLRAAKKMDNNNVKHTCTLSDTQVSHVNLKYTLLHFQGCAQAMPGGPCA